MFLSWTCSRCPPRRPPRAEVQPACRAGASWRIDLRHKDAGRTRPMACALRRSRPLCQAGRDQSMTVRNLDALFKPIGDRADRCQQSAIVARRGHRAQPARRRFRRPDHAGQSRIDRAIDGEIRHPRRREPAGDARSRGHRDAARHGAGAHRRARRSGHQGGGGHHRGLRRKRRGPRPGAAAGDARRGAAASAAHRRAELPRLHGAGPRPQRQLRASRRRPATSRS